MRTLSCVGELFSCFPVVETLLCFSLVVDPALSGPTVRVSFWWRRSLHRTESETQGRGLGVPVWTGTWTPGTEE